MPGETNNQAHASTKETQMLSIFTDLQLRVRESLSRTEGAGIVEYLLLVVFIALALIVALAFFSGALGDAFRTTANSITEGA
jgi:Flp pilus assembly pilin Flp